MKYKYANISKRYVTFFAALSMLVVCVNIAGLTSVPTITLPNLVIILFMLMSSILSGLYLVLGYKKFDFSNHRKLVKNLKNTTRSKVPSVNVFLPSAGEDLKTLNRTFSGVSKIKYPKRKISVFVLDDKGDEGVKRLAKGYG